MGKMPKKDQVCEELVRLLRVQRHDFINHLQVIHAMLQLGRAEKALTYIEELAKDGGLVDDQIMRHTRQRECKHNLDVV
ncbi:hypothetical protein SDC9_09018 [bioreactor metagenome]|uniref:SpoOB alpha-helical domain-containing protein n=1 Tax=bioreactor metagenome TaxID=1076179 RepID=A0A644TBY5_9ZZZZ|nr:Spo0B domain-containing protein [Negativicutes bacterium]